MLDDSDTSDDEETAPPTSTTTTTSTRLLIEEVPTSTSTPPPQPSQTSLITEVSSSASVGSVVSPDEICLEPVEAKHDEESDRLLEQLGAISQSSMIKAGVIGGNQDNLESDVERVREIVGTKSSENGSSNGNDGLGDLD